MRSRTIARSIRRIRTVRAPSARSSPSTISIDIDPHKLTRSHGNGGCTPVFPHDYLRVNTLFEVVKAAGGRTARSDKEQSYDILRGPSGRGVDDLYNREIAAGGTTGSLTATEAYDDTKVAAIVNEIDGKSSTGAPNLGVPKLFGMNFQAVSVGQKLAVDPTSGLSGGYVDASVTPRQLLARALAHTDASLGKMLAELAQRDLAESTLVVISAKHRQAPIDRAKRRGIAGAGGSIVVALAGNNVGFVQTDDLALIWLNDRSEPNERSALANLQTLAGPLGFRSGKIYTGSDRPRGFASGHDPRPPDFSIAPTQAVETTQVAPTILEALGIDGRRLQAVAREGTEELPGSER